MSIQTQTIKNAEIWQVSASLSKTANYTLTDTDRGKLIQCNGTFAITFPAIVDGAVYTIKNIGTGAITLTPNGAQITDVTVLLASESVILVGDAANTKWRSLAKEVPSGGSTATELSFTNSDLTSGILTVTHNKGLTAGYTALVTIINNSGAVIIPDQINTFATNSFKVDLSSFGSISSTWRVIYLTKSEPGATEIAFTNSDLTAGILTVTHNRGLSAGYPVMAAIINNSGAVIIPDQINTFATNSFKVDLSSYGAITGTYYVIYITK